MLLGRGNAIAWYRIAVAVWILDIVVNVAIWHTAGLIIMPFMLLAAYPLVKALLSNPLTPDRRLQAMPQILSVNIVLGAFYAAALLAPAAVTLVL